MYQIKEVDGVAYADVIQNFNQQVGKWPELQEKHYTNGYWWLVYLETEPVAFAGLVPMEPFIGYGYCKRCFVKPDHHGRGLQFRLLLAREEKAKQLGWTHLISECEENNLWSASNFIKAGFKRFDPEQSWGEKNSLYYIKEIMK
jgi:GNAT superfamily N-acetyltransferase